MIRVEGPIDEIQTCEGSDAELELTVYPNADHDAWTRTYDLSAGHDIYAWMLEHTNDENSSVGEAARDRYAPAHE